MQHVSVRELNQRTKLPFTIYEGSWTIEHPMPHAVFTIEGGKCELIAGDLGVLLSRDFSEQSFLAFSARAYNAAVRRADPFHLDTDIEMIEYAFSVCSVVDPYVNAIKETRLMLLWNKKDFEKKVREVAMECSETEEARRTEVGKARQQYEAPHILEDVVGQRVVFFSWGNIGGLLWKHTIGLSAEGLVDIHTEVTARHVGAHIHLVTQVIESP